MKTIEAKRVKQEVFVPPTRRELDSVWSEVAGAVGSDEGTGYQDHHTVIWLFFAEPENRHTITRGEVSYHEYMHPRYTGRFDIPVSHGVSVATVKKLVTPLLQAGFEYRGYST